jgi:hypothetical protein
VPPLSDETFDDTDRRRAAHCFAQGRDDRRSRPVAPHVHDAPGGVCGFASHGEPAFEITVERDAIGQEIVNARRGLAGDPECDGLIDETATDRNGIGGVRFRRIAFGDRRGDAALRPCG